MPKEHRQTTAEPKKMDPVLKAHLNQDLGVPIAAVFERDEGMMAGEDAISFVLEAQRLLRLGRAEGDTLTSGYVYGEAHYFLNSNDPTPPPPPCTQSHTLASNPADIAKKTAGADLDAPHDPTVAEPHHATRQPRAHALLAAMVEVAPGQPSSPEKDQQAPDVDDNVSRRVSVRAPMRVVFQGTVVQRPTASPRAGPEPCKPTPAVQCTFQGTQTHVLGKRRKRLSIEGPAQHELTAGTRLAYEGGVTEKLRLIDASLVAQQDLPMNSPEEIPCQTDDGDHPS